MFNALLIVSLFSQLSFAQQSTVPTQNDNIAVVAWTGYDNEKVFQQGTKLMSDVFCDPDGAFRVKKENYVTIKRDAAFPEDFSTKFKEAVNKIKDKSNPILIVALESHGDKGVLYRETSKKDIINYDKNSDKPGLVDILFENSFDVDEVGKKITLMLFIDVCFSGSIIPVIQKKVSCDTTTNEECPLEGTDGASYKQKISVYTSAPSNERSWGIEFWDNLNLVSKLEDIRTKKAVG